LTACLYTLFLRVQRKRTSSKAAKEKAANHLSAFGGYPALLEITGRYETRGVYALQGAQTVLALIRLFLCCLAA